MKEYCPICTIKYKQDIVIEDGKCQYCKSEVVNVTTAVDELREKCTKLRLDSISRDYLNIRIRDLEISVQILKQQRQNRTWLYKFIWGDY